MGAEELAQALATLTLQIHLVGVAVFALSWTIGSILRGGPIPPDYRKLGTGMLYDALKGSFLISIWSGVSALISYVASLLLSAV